MQMVPARDQIKPFESHVIRCHKALKRHASSRLDHEHRRRRRDRTVDRWKIDFLRSPHGKTRQIRGNHCALLRLEQCFSVSLRPSSPQIAVVICCEQCVDTFCNKSHLVSSAPTRLTAISYWRSAIGSQASSERRLQDIFSCWAW